MGAAGCSVRRAWARAAVACGVLLAVAAVPQGAAAESYGAGPYGAGVYNIGQTSSSGNASLSLTVTEGGAGGHRHGASAPAGPSARPASSASARSRASHNSQGAPPQAKGPWAKMRERLAARIDKRMREHPELAAFLRRILERLNGRTTAP